MSNLENKQCFSLRKLSVGLASVLVGISIFSTSQTVKADTVTSNQGSTVTNNAQSSDTQENENATKSTFSNDNQSDNVKSNLIQTQVDAKKDQKQDFASKIQDATDDSNLDAEKDTVKTSSLQEKSLNNHAEDNAQAQNSQKLDLPKSSKKLARKVLATNSIATTSSASSTMTNGGFDEATWGKLDVNNWQGSVQNGVYLLTDYTGNSRQIIVPNEADFEKAGKSTNGLQVGITRDTVQSLIAPDGQRPSTGGQLTIAFSKTSNQKVKAIGTDWSYAFSVDPYDMVPIPLGKFDGSNFDVSNVTNMRGMFYRTSMSDLTSLVDWDTRSVTDMSAMFALNPIRDLKPLANWKTSNVTDMSNMFDSMFGGKNSISDLKPLANWDTNKVTDMSGMFGCNSISDLKPLANWKTSKVTDMSRMFEGNINISDLSPITNWNISGRDLFRGNDNLNLTNIKNDAPLMQGFLKDPDALYGATYITNNADLVKATTNQDLPTLTDTATRTITFYLPHAEPKTITQVINYKAIATVQAGSYSEKIIKTYPIKESDWQLDTSKQNADVIVNGVICFKPVKIPHINGYKAHLVRNEINPAMLMVSFVAVPSENKPSLPDEETPSKSFANPDKSNTDDLQQRVVTELNSNDSSWTMPTDNPISYEIKKGNLNVIVPKLDDYEFHLTDSKQNVLIFTYTNGTNTYKFSLSYDSNGQLILYVENNGLTQNFVIKNQADLLKLIKSIVK